MKFYIRNITKDTEMCLSLPLKEKELNDKLDRNCEYIIIDSEIPNVDEYESVHVVNRFLLSCVENGINLEDIKILSATYLFSEVMKMVIDESYTIVDFDMETSDWNSGYGGNFTNGTDKGMCLFDGHYYNPFGFEMSEEIYDWIDWDSVWTNANCEGWREVTVNEKHYLVKRY